MKKKNERRIVSSRYIVLYVTCEGKARYSTVSVLFNPHPPAKQQSNIHRRKIFNLILMIPQRNRCRDAVCLCFIHIFDASICTFQITSFAYAFINV